MLNNDLRIVIRKLVHDLGKYIARTACNVREADWTPELVEMLLADLYDLKGERAEQVFLRHVPEEPSAFPEWRIIRHLLGELDGMESALVKGELQVVHVAAEKAMLVEHTLRMALDRVEASPAP